jgi:hypothetical protein
VFYHNASVTHQSSTHLSFPPQLTTQPNNEAQISPFTFTLT